VSEAQLSTDTIAKLKHVSTATLTTQLFKRGLRNVYLQGVRRLSRAGPNMVGPAFTLRNIPAREDLDQMHVFEDPEHPQRKSIEICPPGHVLVVDCRRDTQAASAGDILLARLEVRGVAGFVSDGCVRDSAGVAERGFPVYCAGGAAPLNLVRHHAADYQRPIACGGVAVYPGDVIVGDGEGVVVIPCHLADEVARDAAEQEALEAFVIEEIRGGRALPGVYPANAATKARYAEWRKRRDAPPAPTLPEGDEE
jgi:regulator of RNase E activity RraA